LKLKSETNWELSQISSIVRKREIGKRILKNLVIRWRCRIYVKEMRNARVFAKTLKNEISSQCWNEAKTKTRASWTRGVTKKIKIWWINEMRRRMTRINNLADKTKRRIIKGERRGNEVAVRKDLKCI